MFYFTGLAHVNGIDSNHYHPGAIADHLTSAGGKLTGSGQMSSLRWLEAGATGSYGAVVEPCAFVQKFPRPNIVIDRYLEWRNTAGVLLEECRVARSGRVYRRAVGGSLPVDRPPARL